MLVGVNARRKVAHEPVAVLMVVALRVVLLRQQLVLPRPPRDENGSDGVRRHVDRHALPRRRPRHPQDERLAAAALRGLAAVLRRLLVHRGASTPFGPSRSGSTGAFSTPQPSTMWLKLESSSSVAQRRQMPARSTRTSTRSPIRRI